MEAWDVVGPADPAGIAWSVGDGQLNSVTLRHGDTLHQMPEYATVSVSSAMAALDPGYVIRMAALGAAEYLAAESGQELSDVAARLGGFDPLDFRPVEFRWAGITRAGHRADLGHGVHLLLPDDQPPPFCVAFRGAETPTIVSAIPDAWPAELVELADVPNRRSD